MHHVVYICIHIDEISRFFEMLIDSFSNFVIKISALLFRKIGIRSLEIYLKCLIDIIYSGFISEKEHIISM